MVRSPQVAWTSLLLVGILFLVMTASFCAAQTPAAVRRVAVLRSGGTVEIEIQTSQHLMPQVQVLTGPDRIVFDFPALPGPGLRAVAVPRGEVKGVRTGLFEAKPPITRVVFDLKTPQDYQLFSYGKAVIVKVGGTASAANGPPPSQTATSTPPVAAAPPPPPPVTVGFENGMLSVTADRASLAEVLYQIQVHTGAEIAVPSGAEQEKVVATLGPAPARDVLTDLLQGSSYNFIILGSPQDPKALERVILTPRGPAIPEVSAMTPPPASPPPSPETDPPQHMVEPPPAVMPGPGPDAVQGNPPQPGNPNPPQN